MSEVTVSKIQAQNWLLKHSFLLHPAKDALTVLRALSCIQVDPINVVARSHELAMWNRVEGFQKTGLDKLLYETRELTEYWLQLYSFIPIEYFPYLRARMHYRAGWHGEFESKYKVEIGQTLDYVREHGATSARDLAHIGNHVRALFSWSNSNSRTSLLNYLWDTGELMVSHRVNNLKVYDLTERLLPKQYQHEVPQEEAFEFMVLSNFDYLGLVSSMQWHRFGYSHTLPIRHKFTELIEKQQVLPVRIEGVKSKYYIRVESLADLQSMPDEKLHTGLNILPPLDPLLINRRKTVGDIFDFEYLWEAYVPADKRKFGYYSMPILYYGQFVGQIDLKKLPTGRLQRLNLVTTDKSPEFKTDLKRKLDLLQNFVS